jgi:uncharacterized OB-fold protein
VTRYYRCKTCKRSYFEPRGMCKCGGEDWEEVEVEDREEVCTELRVTPSGFPDTIKFCLTWAEGTRGWRLS